jgi:phage/plasmid-like protein (TIGR03299 family)
MMSVRQVPWHGVGTIVEEQLTAADALREAGLDWSVTKVPVFTQIGTEYVEVPGKYATVREDSGDALGIVGEPYTVIQNEEAFAFADGLVDSGDAKYETAGSLRGGRQVWMMMAMPEGVTVAGDEEIELYLALTNSHDGSSAVRAMATPVRIVCKNTLNFALQRAQRTWSVRHVGGLQGRLDEARRALDLTFEYIEEFKDVANGLASEKFSDMEFEQLVAQLTESETEREGLIEAYRTSDNIDNVRHTKWGAVNAIGEYADWLRPIRTDEARFRNSMAGNGRKMRDKALALVTA